MDGRSSGGGGPCGAGRGQGAGTPRPGRPGGRASAASPWRRWAPRVILLHVFRWRVGAGGCCCWRPSPCPTHPFLIGIPRGERQKHNQKCSSKKKRHSGSRQTFLARTFPAGLQVHPRSTVLSWLPRPLASSVTEPQPSAHPGTPTDAQDPPLPPGLAAQAGGCGLRPAGLRGGGI